MALRAVKPGETAPKSKPRAQKTIIQAVVAGDRLAELKATHLRIAKAVQDPKTPARDLASLTRRQLEISREIEALEKQREEEEAEDGGATPDEDWEQEAI